ncbi:MAG TPA: hypothetical protein VK892_22650 [Pyrinomonadaceae bacterium]|nr:hypothetical protein [Pyrinomonadaceae bacterium]
MTAAPKILNYLLILSLCWLPACKVYDDINANANSNASNTNQTINIVNKDTPPKDSAAELGKIINLPFMPEEADWREEPVAQSNDNKAPVSNQRRLIAVLKFSPEDMKKVIEQAEKHNPPAEATLEAEDWFPAELTTQSQLSGDETLKGTAYAANDFIIAPFNNGRLTRISETDFFVLELYSM